MTKPKGLFYLAIFTVILLWIQARMPTWNNHMQVDVWVMWERLNYWMTHNHSFVGITGNEILPATLLYLFTPLGLVPVGGLVYANFLPIMMMLNAITLGAHWFFVNNKYIFLTSLLFLGPILLFRFDGLVTLLLLLSFYTFANGKYAQSGFSLGLATGMKVFPIIFLPYLILILLNNKHIKGLQQLLVFFGEALIVPVLIFFLLGGTYPQILAALAFHSQKLISIESLPGSMITGWSLLTHGHPPIMIPGNGIWAVAGPSALLNRSWLLPIALIYIAVYLRKNLVKKFNYLIPYTLILIFLVFSKNLNPQYLWWFMAILPFISPSPLTWGITLVVALLNQLVFPLFYTIFVDSFFGHNQNYWIYYLLLLRNIGIIFLCYLSIRELFSKK